MIGNKESIEALLELNSSLTYTTARTAINKELKLLRVDSGWIKPMPGGWRGSIARMKAEGKWPPPGY